MIKSPTLIFVADEEERIPSPMLIFEEEEVRVPSPELIFEEEEETEEQVEVVVSPVLVFMEEGTFFSEDADFCSFVLSRGRKGEICGKKATDSALLERPVPACIHHLAKYEEKMMLQSSFLTVRPTYTASYAEDFEEHSPVPKAKKPKPMFTLDSIPKAIDRSRGCPVCIEPDCINPLLFPCGHTVCFECTSNLKKEKCPTCREPFKKTQLRLL